MTRVVQESIFGLLDADIESCKKPPIGGARNLHSSLTLDDRYIRYKRYLKKMELNLKPEVIVETTESDKWASAHENDGKSKYHQRDIIGYGRTPINPQWPHNAKVALNFVINYEEGGESCILHGDAQSEFLLSDIPGAQPMSKF